MVARDLSTNHTALELLQLVGDAFEFTAHPGGVEQGMERPLRYAQLHWQLWPTLLFLSQN